VAIAVSLAFIAAASSPALADQVRRNEWWLSALHVTNAWETTRGPGVTIAVLDTGVDPAQADLTGSVTTGPDYTNSGRTAGGQFWGIHGTEVASLIAGHGHGPDQANGIIGIAPAAKILSVRVTLESNDPMLSNQTIAAGLPNAIARGIRWAVRHHASVIDLPLDPVTTSGAPGSGGSPAERAAIDYAIAKKVILVAPAGDGYAGTDPVNYPAAYRGVIAVGAFDRHFVKAPFTSHQPYVLVTAAGAGIAAANPSGNYPQLNSTSAASAMVAGIVALIQAQFPTLAPAQITHAITASTMYHPPGGRANGSGFGTVDAAKALTAAAGIAERVSKSATSGTAGQAPPSQPAVHSSPIHRNIRGTLIKDAAIAGVVFLLLLGLIFAITAWRRRNARAARLAEVRAAVQPPVRRPAGAKPAARGSATKGVPAGSQAGSSGPDAEAAEPQLEPAGFIAAPLGPAAGGPGASGFTGSASSGFTGSAAGFTGSAAGFTGSGFTRSAAGFTGSASGFTGSASSGFAAPGPTPPGSGGLAALGAAGMSPPGGIKPPAAPGPSAGIGSPAGLGPAGMSPPAGVAPPAGLGPSAGIGPSEGPGSSAGLGSSAGPTAHDSATAGEAPSGPAQPAGAGTATPPWALISQDPAVQARDAAGVQARDAASAAIPESAFLAAPAPGPASEPGSGSEPAPGGAGQTRMSSRLTQAPRQPRTPQVSGRPPWEPAPEPNSELPWAQGPAPSRSAAAPLPRREQVRPELPSWEELAQDAWPGGPKLASPYPPLPSPAGPNSRPGEGGRPAGGAPAGRVVPAAGLVPPQPDSPEQPRRTENRPGYGWNTGAGVEPFRAAQSELGPVPGGTGAAQAGGGPPVGAAQAAVSASAVSASAVSPSAVSPSAVSQPGVSPARRPSLALPRRLGSSMARQAEAGAGAAGAAGAGSGTNPVGGGLAGQGPAGGGLAGPGRADSGLGTSGASDAASADPPWQVTNASDAGPAGPTWPVTGAGQPPFPPAPRPAAEPSLPGAGQPERGPFPRAIKPPTDPGAAGTAAWGAGTIDTRSSAGSPSGPAVPDGARPAGGGPGLAKGAQPGTSGALPSTARPGAAKPRTAKHEAGRSEAGRSEAGSTQPKTGVPPWEITDSFLAVPPAGASAAQASAAPATAGQPSNPSGASTGGGGPADSTESFPAVGSGADQRSFPRSNPGDSIESFPAMRPRADLEDAFRLFPPVRGTDNRPPADGQD
jgi:serine protease